MPTYTITDGVTTITFSAFIEVSRRLEAVDVLPITYPDFEGSEDIDIGRRRRIFTIRWRLQDDPDFPGSGDSAADKRKAFEDLHLSGGATEGLFTLTFDSEDSIPTAVQTESYIGHILIIQIRSIGGEHVSEIEGEFEFREQTVT